MTIDALYLNCKDMQEDKILEQVFWINPVFENVEGNTQSINYTVRFTNKPPDNSNVYLIVSVLVFTLGLAFIIILTLSRFGEIQKLQSKYNKLSLE